MKRAVEIVWDDQANIDNVRKETDGKLDSAIGYLATWGLGGPNYQHVHIYVSERDFEISAVYTREPREVGKSQQSFLLVGIWRKDKREYSFHS